MIEAVNTDNLAEVLPLIQAYQDFYGVPEVSNEQNTAFFSQFGPESPLGCQFLYRFDGKAVGFATVYFTFSSTAAVKVGVMNDLFTSPEVRRQGVGRALIQHCRDFALAQGAQRLQWMTAPDNSKAQALYDSLTTAKSEWLLYIYR